MNIIGYGICGAGEADRYMEETLKEFDRLCDETFILLNNAGKKEKELVKKYGFYAVEDNREWGRHQYKIKENFFNKYVTKAKANAYVCLDMDEVFDETFTRTKAELLAKKGGVGYYFYIVNLIDDGYSKDFSFFNVRFWVNGYFSKEWEKKPLHCGLAPKSVYEWGNYAPHIVFHYGLKDKADRAKKATRYAKYDPDARYVGKQYYDLLESNIEPNKLNINELRKEVEDYASKTYFKQHKETKDMSEKFYYVKTVDGRILDIPEKNIDEELARGSILIDKDPIVVGGEDIKSSKVEEEVEEVEEVEEKAEDDSLECEVCGFVAKTKAGLTTHKKKHK